MTSNRQKFINLIVFRDSLIKEFNKLKSDLEYKIWRTNVAENGKELERLYDLNHKTLNQEEINRLATAYKCPNCNCSSCLDKKEEEKSKGFNCPSYGCYWCEKVNDPTYPCERCDAFEREKEKERGKDL